MSRSDDENYHGLVADSYDLFRGDAPVENETWFGFYKRRLEERPGLALEDWNLSAPRPNLPAEPF